MGTILCFVKWSFFLHVPPFDNNIARRTVLYTILCRNYRFLSHTVMDIGPISGENQMIIWENLIPCEIISNFIRVWVMINIFLKVDITNNLNLYRPKMLKDGLNFCWLKVKIFLMFPCDFLSFQSFFEKIWNLFMIVLYPFDFDLKGSLSVFRPLVQNWISVEVASISWIMSIHD